MKVGSNHIGVRASSDALADALRDAVQEHVVSEEPSTTLSVRLSPDRVHFLYWGGCTAVRTRDPERLLAGLASHLGGHGPPRTGLHRLSALALIGADGVVLAPERWRGALARLEPHLHPLGITAHDGPWVDIDPEQREVVVGAPAIELEAGARQAAVGLAPGATRADPAVRAGRYPIQAWLFDGSDSAPEPLSPLSALVQLGNGLTPSTPGRLTPALLWEVLADVGAWSVTIDDAPGVARFIRNALGAGTPRNGVEI